MNHKWLVCLVIIFFLTTVVSVGYIGYTIFFVSENEVTDGKSN